MKDIHVFGDPVIFQVGSVPITRTILTTLAVSGTLVFVAALARMMLSRGPHGVLATVAEMVVSALDGLVTDIVGRRVDWLGTFAGSLFLFIVACNLSGQLPAVTPPTANLVTTSALAIIVFFAVPIVGISSRGLRGYLRHYLSPNPILFPLHMITEFSRTLALAVRLFGNIMSGQLIVAMLVALAGVVVPATMMALDVLIGLLQAYIFTLLSIVYIGAGLRTAEEEEA